MPLDIYLGADDDKAVAAVYDYLSLVSFLECFPCSPALDGFVPSVSY